MFLESVFTLTLPMLAALTIAAIPTDDPQAPGSVHDFTVKSIDGKDVDLSSYKGDVLLIVNTASQCGYTPQYSGLQTLFETYKDQGFQVLAFPANEFGGQEPGSDTDIQAFCSSRYNVSFPLFSKIVVKGQGQHPLYAYLTNDQTNPKFAGDIPWNFTKFLVDREGNIVARFNPGDAPESPEMTSAIQKAIAEGK